MSPYGISQLRKIELRFAARGLVNKDLFSLSDPFLVCHTVRDGVPHRQLGRTETVQDDLNPVWATTISFDCDRRIHNDSTTLVVDIFDRDSRDSDSLSKHDFLGRALFRLSDLFNSPHMRLDLPLRPASAGAGIGAIGFPSDVPSAASSLTDPHDSDDDAPPSLLTTKAKVGDKCESEPSFYDGPPSVTGTTTTTSSAASDSVLLPLDMRESKAAGELRRATSGLRANKVQGYVSVFAEDLSMEPSPALIRLRVRSALLRDTCALSKALCGFRVTQFYEIQRERLEGSTSSWSCIYRSKDGQRVDKYNYVVFDEISIDEKTLCNMRRDRKIRIAFYKRRIRHQHDLIAYVTTTVGQLENARAKGDSALSLKMEGEFSDDDGLGSVSVESFNIHRHPKSQPGFERLSGDPSETDDDDGEKFVDNILIKLRADHFLNKRFISSLNEAPSYERRIRKKPTFFTLH